MILGVGTDLANIERIQGVLDRHGDRFRNRVFTEIEQARSERRAERAASYAKRFAAKEAVAKALGSGFSGGITMKDIGVVTGERGEPRIQLSGAAQKRLAAITPGGHETFIHLALSDEPPLAQAVVIIEARSA